MNDKNLQKLFAARLGTGSEADPFRSDDGSAGIASELQRFLGRGGRLNLPCGRYDLAAPLVIDTPSLCLSGDVWACNIDPNGVFESMHGTKLRLAESGIPAIRLGATRTLSGTVIRDLGIQGNIPGMDTRCLTDFENPLSSAGLVLDSVRTDQCEISKLSFCGLGSAVVATGNAEIDACIFEKINTDGCGNGFFFAPRASYYARVRACIAADNPYYGFYAGGVGKTLHNLEIFDCHFVRNGGSFTDGDTKKPAAVLFDGISSCAVSHCIFDDPGTFWYYDDTATENTQRQPSHRKTVALWVIGNKNRIRDNTFLRSSDDSIRIEGDGNILLSNIADGSVRIYGTGNTVANLIFTSPSARLILEGEAQNTTTIIGVPEERIVRAEHEK